MPKRAKELQPAEVRRLNKPGYHPVGGVAGLLLVVKPSGAKSWVLRYSTGETRVSAEGNPYAVRRDFGLGPFPDVGLKDARERAREARDDLFRGVDPIDARRERNRARLEARQRNVTFRECARMCHEAKAPGFRSEKHKNDWINSLKIHAFPKIGNVPVNEIDVDHVRRVLDTIWTTKTETATRVRQRIEAVLGYAKTARYRDGDNPAAWSENLENLLPNPSSVTKVQNFRSLKYDDCPAFMAELKKRDGTGARALEFAILTAARTGEVRGATWDEIDFKRRTWTIPAEKMKADEEHVVPLSDAAMAVLDRQPRDSDYIFPAVRGGKLSDMTLLAVLKRMNYYDKTTCHGFRSSFANWAINETDEPDFVSEECLAHNIGNEVRKHYKNRTRAAKRLKLMREWARYLGYREQGAKVTKLEASA